MKLRHLACLASLCIAGSALAQSPSVLIPPPLSPLAPVSGQPVNASSGLAQAGLTQLGSGTTGVALASGVATSGTGIAQVSHCGCAGPCDGVCASSCSTGSCGVDGCYIDECDDTDCGGILGGGGAGFNCGGDPFSILGHCGSFKMGGWAQMGYHNRNNILFNNRKNEYQLHQAWLYAEKEIDTTCGGGIGGRIDYVYGTDGPNTQAFGIDNSHWDNGWDNGSPVNGYGHALPQLYFEAGYGDFRVKAGKFFTIIGYEVVAAPDNFFYSHAYTFNFSEPFTHTGALLTYQLNEDVEIYGGYVFGWDSGFEDNGDAYLGGATLQLTEDIKITSATVSGRLNEKALRFNNGNQVSNLAERGWMHSTVAQFTLTDKIDYIFQTDWLDTEIANGQTARETYGINQYLLYAVNDCLGLGTRFEWWNVDRDSGLLNNQEANIYALTLGSNIKPHPNVVIRPEVRWDWSNVSGVLEDPNDDRQTTFGIDSILLF